MLGDIPTGGDSQSFGKRLLKFEPFVSGVWRPPNWTPEWKFLNLALCTTKCAFFTEIGDLIPWTTAPSRNEMQQFAPARCLGPPTSHYGGHGRCWCCLRHASWGFGSCGAVVIRARHESLGFSSRVGWTGCDTFSETYHFRTYIHAYTCHIDICIYVYTPDTCMHIWSYLYTHTYSHRAKHILSVLLRHLTPWSFLVFDGFQWLIASIFFAKNVWVMLVTSPMHYSACTQGFLTWIISLETSNVGTATETFLQIVISPIRLLSVYSWFKSMNSEYHGKTGRCVFASKQYTGSPDGSMPVPFMEVLRFKVDTVRVARWFFPTRVGNEAINHEKKTCGNKRQQRSIFLFLFSNQVVFFIVFPHI